MKNLESNRRDFIKTASIGGLGAGFLGAGSMGQNDNNGLPLSKPPQNAKIKITDIKVAVISNSPVVRIVTDAGISGYGQVETTKPYLKPHILFYKDYLIGEDPTNVERCLMKIRRMGSFKPWGAAVSAIEFALWDIAGKAANLPVYKLMGGKIRDHVRCYNGAVRVQRTGDTAKDFYDWAVKIKNLEQGFTIVKTAVGFHGGYANTPGFYYGNTTRSQSTKDVGRRGPMTEYGLKLIVERVAAIKEGLGDKVGLALDCGPGNLLGDAIRLANALEPFNLLWLEDLLTGDYTPYVMADDYLELTRSTSVPIHTGEQIYLRQNFRELIEKNAVRVVGPDPEDVGGIAEIKWIAEFADLHGIQMAPHGVFDGLIGLAAHVMSGAAMPENYIAFEYPAPTEKWWYEIIEGLPDPIVKDGLIEVWDRPGLGVNFNVKAAKQYLSAEDNTFFD
ncbi:MAG: mandelate racemase/muconate lactonizing enzyme family protein [Bacteroidales bacterium]|jgi:L-alanine-DL-glutamate epimerase-like enolase superfamily enzyme|nr:mandelate racemase/muconate lactonizing enzyme family protein [Bacteroidales bacterium]